MHFLCNSQLLIVIKKKKTQMFNIKGKFIIKNCVCGLIRWEKNNTKPKALEKNVKLIRQHLRLRQKQWCIIQKICNWKASEKGHKNILDWIHTYNRLWFMVNHSLEFQIAVMNMRPRHAFRYEKKKRTLNTFFFARLTEIINKQLNSLNTCKKYLNYTISWDQGIACKHIHALLVFFI